MALRLFGASCSDLVEPIKSHPTECEDEGGCLSFGGHGCSVCKGESALTSKHVDQESSHRNKDKPWVECISCGGHGCSVCIEQKSTDDIKTGRGGAGGKGTPLGLRSWPRGVCGRACVCGLALMAPDD